MWLPHPAETLKQNGTWNSHHAFFSILFFKLKNLLLIENLSFCTSSKYEIHNSFMQILLTRKEIRKICDKELSLQKMNFHGTYMFQIC